MLRFELSWVKLRAWELTDFDVVLLLDADVTVIGDISPLFTLPTHFAAVPDQQYNDPAVRCVPPEALGSATLCVACWLTSWAHRLWSHGIALDKTLPPKAWIAGPLAGRRHVAASMSSHRAAHGRAVDA